MNPFMYSLKLKYFHWCPYHNYSLIFLFLCLIKFYSIFYLKTIFNYFDFNFKIYFQFHYYLTCHSSDFYSQRVYLIYSSLCFVFKSRIMQIFKICWGILVNYLKLANKILSILTNCLNYYCNHLNPSLLG